MSMTVVVTRNVPNRYRGFLASVLLEVSPGTYVGPQITSGVRGRIWRVCEEWSSTLGPDSCVTMLWRDASRPSGLGIAVLGSPRTELVDHDGIWLGQRALTAAEEEMIRALEEAEGRLPLSDN